MNHKPVKTLDELLELDSNIEIQKDIINGSWDLSNYFLDGENNVKKAYHLLKIHSEWRRGEDKEMIDSRDLTIALSIALQVMEDAIYLYGNEKISF
jgi:hypothetical protein